MSSLINKFFVNLSQARRWDRRSLTRWSLPRATWPDCHRDSATANYFRGCRRPRSRRSRDPTLQLGVPRTRPSRIFGCYGMAGPGFQGGCLPRRKCCSRLEFASATSGASPLCCCAYPRTPWTPRVASTCSSTSLKRGFSIRFHYKIQSLMF